MASPSWIEAALPGLLPCLWVYAGLGLPWAFAAAPRRDWQSRPLIAALALALGPAWLTAWMLALGLLGAQLDQPMLTTAWIMPGSLVISLLGMGLAWRRRQPAPTPSRNTALAADEKLIIALIIIAVALRWLHTAYFPFTAYDALWVFGYQGRLFALEGMVPNSIDYYPPFLSLQFAFVQILTGAINDHAARMILPFMHIGGILAATLLGQRLLNRRVGLIVAALWSLHPFVGQWSFRGDLELTLSFTFTLAALFLLEAWARKRGSAPPSAQRDPGGGSCWASRSSPNPRPAPLSGGCCCSWHSSCCVPEARCDAVCRACRWRCGRAWLACRWALSGMRAISCWGMRRSPCPKLSG